jgi:sec-independent protein translocase protein TatA
MNLGATEIIIIAVVVILLFGAKKMPQMARSLGQSMRIIKAETKGMRNDDESDAKPEAAAPAVQQAPAPQLSSATPEKSPEQMKAEIDELQRKLAAQEQAQKNAS